MNFQENYPLSNLNTFGLKVQAALFTSVTTTEELKGALQNATQPFMILGGGSNVLFTDDYPGLVIKNSIKGINVTEQHDDHLLVEAGAGEVWHELVMHTLDKNWGGLENLSLIPGTVGAAPMQNIGAYGVEIKDVFHSLRAVEIATLNERTFTLEECQFGYRESVFKTNLKGQYVITHVTFRLSKRDHALNTSYGAIQQVLDERQISEPTIRDVSDAVISIRQSKLPNPAEIGNAGSFFKNPTITTMAFESLKGDNPDMPGYPVEGGIKVPAGWCIEQCGWKGHVENRIGVHKNQALVLVNYGGGKGDELKELAFKIQRSVKDKFGIELTPEVNFI